MRSTALALAVLATTASPALAAPGDLDPSFSGDGFDTQNVLGDDCARDVAVQPDGKIIVVGGCDGIASPRFAVLRYLPDGNPDQDFGTDGTMNVSFDGTTTASYAWATAVAVQPDGKIVVAGRSTLSEDGTTGGGGENFAVARLEADGDLDPDFRPNGQGNNQDGRFVANFSAIDYVADVALGADGSIFVGGTPAINTAGDFGIMKLTPQGTLDTTYDSDGKAQLSIGNGDELHAIALQPDGKVVATGFTGATAFPTGANRTIALARFTTTGQPDPSFDNDGMRTLDLGAGGEDANGMALDASGRIVVGGFSNSGADTGVARLLPGDGALDLSFGGDGIATIDTGAADAGYDLALLQDGRVVVGGDTETGANPNNPFVALLTDNGAPDAGFGNQPGRPGVAVHDFGAPDHLDGLAAQADNRIIFVGHVPGRDFLTARLQGPPLPSAPPPPGDTPPDVNSLAVTRAFAAARRGGAILGARRRVPVGGNVRYGLSEAASTRFTVERAGAGRRVSGRCVRPTRRNRSRRRCTRYVRVRGSFVHQGGAGVNRFRFSGRLRNHRLPLGRYRLVAVATDAGGNRSAAERRPFRIVRR